MCSFFPGTDSGIPDSNRGHCSESGLFSGISLNQGSYIAAISSHRILGHEIMTVNDIKYMSG